MQIKERIYQILEHLGSTNSQTKFKILLQMLWDFERAFGHFGDARRCRIKLHLAE